MPLLYLLRHGIAESGAEEASLTQQGERVMGEEARGMARLGLRFDAILTSPLPRARRTAEIVAETMGMDAAVEAVAALAPGCTTPSLASALDAHRGALGVLVVGHQPDLGTIAAALAGARGAIAFDKGTLCCLELERWPSRAAGADKPAAVQFVLPARVLRLLA